MLLETSIKGTETIETWGRKLFLRLCTTLAGGELVIREGSETFYLGQPSRDGLKAEILIHHPGAYRRLLTGGSIGAAEAFMDGDWEADNLTRLVQLLLRNRSQLDAMEGGLAKLAGALAKIWHEFNRNTKSGSRKNIAAHYDLGNEFFQLFLDSNLMYSSAMYVTGKETLEEASMSKLDRICRKLDLKPEDHLLEIGTGWGGMAIYAARHYGCRVTTTTISAEQYKAAQERVQAGGVGDRVTVLKEDYRDLTGGYDKVVSIEMVEAVGHHYLNGYFNKINQLLKPEGMALIQAITIEDRRYQQALRTVDFIKRYIFPGSFIPCVSVLTSSAAACGLRLFNLEDIGPSYARTLQEWHSRFNARLNEVRAQGFDERFIRMWRFYLSYCEGGFRERAISNVQMTLVKPDNRREQWLND
ncbi:SAM-dependent methyltransferase [Hahella sp. CCB-MM4]|uniref:SAM-dependent methyltransferase n=1 Tax=Hahella sp. (strain CCB-MM4) TaxID=1926491 RepID=UPI000B9B828B|nr:cyclopropane-fatty-acyl-phospholipid synthase family protein [Hahella sp. CCB-MM4]OZG75321.1 SAM-dependent methyltransferase [Hahella sp. CCB-MM4]